CPPPGKHAAREGTEPHASPSPLHAASPAASPPAASRMPPSCSRESRTRSFAAAETPDSTALLSPGSLSGGSGGATDADAAPARRERKDIGASVGRSERPCGSAAAASAISATDEEGSDVRADASTRRSVPKSPPPASSGNALAAH
ncbi:hypothetical protein EMIHUDRAFT_444680, partial [Emiliania huxleyi CCMP1516]|uniref:Uncharacterized protein n=2 Tax=Emiliania huxleyi TaxID=2903 RepID=A0A0D3JA59_EMIH1